MNTRRSTSLASNPLLIGAVTTLIIVVAVYLAYNANNGLPFVPTYNIDVELPEASGLIPSNQVRIGGSRVGLVTSLTPKQNPKTGRVTAIAHLQLEKKLEPLPADTKAVVQSVSAIGLKYLELIKGESGSKLQAGGTIPVAQTKEAVSIDELFNTFDPKTREAIKVNTNNFGDGLAARGQGINETIAELKPVVENAIPVLHNLASKEANLGGLFVALNRAARQGANVADIQAQYYVDLNTFFSEFATVTKPLEEATAGAPSALKQATYLLPRQAELIDNAAEFMHLLNPSAKALETVAPQLASAFHEGAINLRAASAVTQGTQQSAIALEKFAKNPLVTLAFEDFTRTAELGGPLLAGLAPAQVKCNYVTLAFRNLASIQSQSVGVGTIAHSNVLISPLGPNSEGYPASEPANGPSEEPNGKDTNHLHVNPYPYVSAPGQPARCEAGNEHYSVGQQSIGNLPASRVAGNREFTTRSENLNGSKYSSQQLKELGLG